MGRAPDKPPLELVLPDGTAAPIPAKPPATPAVEAELQIGPRWRRAETPVPPAPPIIDSPAATTAALLEPVRQPLADVVTPVASLLFGIVLSVLPARWRKRFGMSPALVRGTILSGLGEAVCVVGLASIFYQHYATEQASETIHRLAQNQDLQPGDSMMFGMGATLFIGFMLSPLGLTLLYLFGEGLIRATGAAISGEPLGITPLWIIDKIWSSTGALVARIHAGPPIVDELFRDEATQALRIDSCRTRGWERGTLVDIDGHYFQVLSAEQSGASPRPFVYRLEPLSDKVLIRRAVSYRPDDHLRKPFTKTS